MLLYCNKNNNHMLAHMYIYIVIIDVIYFIVDAGNSSAINNLTYEQTIISTAGI